jgi:hypothetical protein
LVLCGSGFPQNPGDAAALAGYAGVPLADCLRFFGQQRAGFVRLIESG